MLDVGGDVTMAGTNVGVLVSPDSIIIGGTLSNTGGGSQFLPTYVEFLSGTIPTALNFMYNTVAVSGSGVDFAGSVTIGDSLLVINGGGLIIDAGEAITVNDDFSVRDGASTLQMSGLGGTLEVNGDITFNGESTSGLLTAGTIIARGNFDQLKRNA